jgi:phosphotransferase system enzyme I (PtsI)
MKTDAPAKPESGAQGDARPGRRGAKPAEQRLAGIAVSPGIVIGTIYDTTEAPAEAPRREITAEGWDAKEALEAVAGLVEAGFNED